jgi:hypothetical protein
MFRVSAIALSFALVLLWVFGLAHAASPWLTWLNLVVGLIAFGTATPFAESRRTGIAGWGSLGVALLGLSIADLARGDRSGLASWTLVVACAFLMLAGYRWQRAERRTGDLA